MLSDLRGFLQHHLLFKEQILYPRNSLLLTADFEKRRRNPSFLKKLWPQNTEVLFFPVIEKLGGLQLITSDEQGTTVKSLILDTEKNC